MGGCWLLDESQEGREFAPRLRDEIHVTLAETPSTGYVWELVDAALSVLILIDDQFETPEDDDLIGAEGLRHVAFRVAEPRSSRLRLEKLRPWQSDLTAVASFEATVHATGPLTEDSEDGLSDRQKQGVRAGGQAA